MFTSMEPKVDSKMPQMVMCGDHLSFTKTELNAKEPAEREKDKPDRRHGLSYTRISPVSSRTGAADSCARATSEQALRGAGAGAGPARRRALCGAAPDTSRGDDTAPNKALLQAALGSFRWPPYLLAVWVLVLLLTHLLHCLVSVLEQALPRLRRACQYFRTWTEAAWKTERQLNQKVYPIGLAVLTGALYTLYFALYLVYSSAMWSIEPLCSDGDDKLFSEGLETKITNYDEINGCQSKSYDK